LKPHLFTLNQAHNFQAESLLKRVASTYAGSTTLCFLSAYLEECLGHFEFKTLLMLSSAFCERPFFFLYQTIQLVVCAELAQARVFFLNQEIFALHKFLSHHSSGWVTTSPAKVFFLRTLCSVLESGSTPK
jgi:hypothetical protein